MSQTDLYTYTLSWKKKTFHEHYLIFADLIISVSGLHSTKTRHWQIIRNEIC